MASPASSIDLLGGPAIERAIQERLDRQEPMAALYIDLINLEPYCYQYGWAKGMQLIAALSQVIQATLTELGRADDVASHICGDEFIILSTPERAEALAQEIIKRFDAVAVTHYSEIDRQRGYFDTVDRRGNPLRAYLAGVAIAIVTNAYRSIEHVLQVNGLAGEVRKYIKLMPGSRYAFDRRQK
jgi:GGDEF domain-containing protein